MSPSHDFLCVYVRVKSMPGQKRKQPSRTLPADDKKAWPISYAHAQAHEAKQQEDGRLPSDLIGRIKAVAQKTADGIVEEFAERCAKAVKQSETNFSTDEEDVLERMQEATEDFRPLTTLTRAEALKFLHFISEREVFAEELAIAMGREGMLDGCLIDDSNGSITDALHRILRARPPEGPPVSK